jgi:hypothetical protein
VSLDEFPGASRVDQLTDTLAGVATRMGAELKQQLDALTAQYRFGDAVR